jgi:predicted amidophosphoribosyltransferase
MQTQLHSKERRLQNLREAFGVVNPRAVTNAHVVVIDDVMTTGATLRSVARTLNGAKPASLSAIVLAVADPRRRDFQFI